MSGLTSGTMKCLGCNKDKPKSDFGTTGNARALCSRCRSGRVINTSRGSARKSSSGNWVGDLFEGIADAIGSIFD
ncbi:hypothetical protein SEA_PARADIDDLES_143 [Streptomyces phage Paradiddles]|uniref:Uncharacterized protein n=1 Tax=Streptomyces phage Paradiddles TaxID=2023993 RepID=A0A222YZ98_9CAUD|nr:hypothetical protein FDI37_gp126 [Streptomyces phage Paradiddles]ASR77602.1 hypothetical protein SEA_PARADIDDLES_143 [Streptomyces phage Paradiddles]